MLKELKGIAKLAGSVAVLMTICAGCSTYPETKLIRSNDDMFKNLVSEWQADADKTAANRKNVAASEFTNTVAAVNIDSKDPLLAEGKIQQSRTQKNVTLNDLFMKAIRHSSQIKVFSDLPMIRETAIREANGLFDPRVFADAKYYDRDDPIGSTLTTGSEANRFLESDTRLSAGIKKKMLPGTELYLYQELSMTTNNSEYFTPNPQSGARIVIGAVQPLLNGYGTKYNMSAIEVARIDSDIAMQELIRQAESHLLEITRTYWSLYMARGSYRAKERAYRESADILQALESRGDFDAVRTQILRARAASTERKADLVRAESAIRNAEERIRTLVNDPELLQAGTAELIPADLPAVGAPSVSMADSIKIAMKQRPEIRQSHLQLRAGAVRLEMADHEKLPSLNLFAEAYLAGLAFDSYPDAWDNQYDGNGPGYMVGLRFEMPLGNEQAQAVNQRRKLEMRQLANQLRTTMETVSLDVNISLREVETGYRDFVAKHESMVAARENFDNLKKRKESVLLSGDAGAVEYQERLLDALDQQADSEEKLMQAMATYNVAQRALQRSQGNLLGFESIEFKRVTQNGQEESLEMSVKENK